MQGKKFITRVRLWAQAQGKPLSLPLPDVAATISRVIYMDQELEMLNPFTLLPVLFQNLL